MKKSNLFYVLGGICAIVVLIIAIMQVYDPHPYRELIRNIVLVIGTLMSFIHAIINHRKSPLYDPDRKKHIRNWVVYILSLVLTVIVVAFIYLKFF